MSRIGILAVQGAFLEHEQVLSRLGVPYLSCAKKGTWRNPWTASYYRAVRVR